MELEIGTEIIVGVLRSEKGRYRSIVGKKGIITNTDLRSGRVLVKVLDAHTGRSWSIFRIDCLPLTPQNNEEAIHLLHKNI